jgi:hypothetical protein
LSSPPAELLPNTSQKLNSQGTWNTVEGSNPGLFSVQARREVAAYFTTG